MAVSEFLRCFPFPFSFSFPFPFPFPLSSSSSSSFSFPFPCLCPCLRFSVAVSLSLCLTFTITVLRLSMPFCSFRSALYRTCLYRSLVEQCLHVTCAALHTEVHMSFMECGCKASLSASASMFACSCQLFVWRLSAAVLRLQSSTFQRLSFARSSASSLLDLRPISSFPSNLPYFRAPLITSAAHVPRTRRVSQFPVKW